MTPVTCSCAAHRSDFSRPALTDSSTMRARFLLATLFAAAFVAAASPAAHKSALAAKLPDSEALPPADVYPPDEDEPTSDWSSFYMAVLMIVVSEIGDKTFLIAALMAMKNPKQVVFSAAFLSLAVMTVLSGVVGHALPALISQRVTQFMAAILFFVFGLKLLAEGLAMAKDAGVDEEMHEVEEELQASSLNTQMQDLEAGSGSVSPASNDSELAYPSTTEKYTAQIRELMLFVLSPLWIQVFIMTFLGEWGDRLQIATIAMAAGSDYWFVILGAIVGHGVCTAAACVGGEMLATKISMRTVTLGGSAAFFVFAVLYLYDSTYGHQ